MSGNVLKENLTKEEQFIVMCLHWLNKQYGKTHTLETLGPLHDAGLNGEFKLFQVTLKNNMNEFLEYSVYMRNTDYEMYKSFDMETDFDALLHTKQLNKQNDWTVILKCKNVGDALLTIV